MEKNLLASFYGASAFVKIKQCLEIGKILFSFVDLKDSKNHIDCYMEAEEFGAILMAGIKNNTLIRQLMEEKAKGEQYPKAVFTSPIGGNATGNNGKPISRYFEISPASKGEVLFTAHAFPAVKNDKGAFIKEQGSRPLLTLRIPCTYNDLKILQYKWSFLEADYMGSKYTFNNMRSDFALKLEDTYTSSSSSIEEDEVLCVGTDSAPKDEYDDIASAAKPIKLIATSEMVKITGMPIKVCKVTLDGQERRMVCLTEKFEDLKKLADFESQLKQRVASKRTLTFTGEIAQKGDDLVLCKFA
ncbi:MAG: hypothetical protein HUJ70_05145 [Pseudobutyrivibrio sp.]|nr:hypothetical protein [Pseudobutyrivibrio sp.]